MKRLFATMKAHRRIAVEATGFLGRLRRDARGNTLALMAAMLIPLAGLTGSAIDMGRLYAVKTRLQQACDAGVLAGRKFLIASTATTIDSNAAAQAQNFFKNNFNSGWFRTSTVSFTPVKTTDNQVSGTATATVPMTLMTVFGVPSKVITVACEARYDVADADIMFVLDTTGSMACVTSSSQSTCDNYVVKNVVTNSDGSYAVTEQSGSRISGLRSAVASFYSTLTSQADASTHYRFGFVPYSATTNVGYLLPRNYLTTSTWHYQTRYFLNDTNNGSATTVTTNSITQAACNATLGHSAYTTNVGKDPGYTANIVTFISWTASSGSGSSATGTCKTSKQPVYAVFRYAQKDMDVSKLATGAAVPNPAMLDGSTTTWNGCIEERATTASASFSATSPPPDLDVDSAPTTDETTHWAPMWDDAEFARVNATTEDDSEYRSIKTRFSGNTGYEYADTYNLLPCPKQAQRLKTMTAADINDYLSAANGFVAYGVTYHDPGITWGTRLLSPNGIFASDTAAWPGHNAPNRFIIFLTDGSMEPNALAYATHGMETWDQRVTGSNNLSNLTAYHNARFTTACTIAKNHNITIFVIAYAQTITTQLQACASPNQAYYASDTTALNTAFSAIAKQVAMLRISK